MNVVILDTGCANLNSVKSAIARHGYEPKVSRDPDVVLLADKLFLPGVGTAQAAMDQVRERELFDLIKACTQPVLGICLGMQLLGRRSEESNGVDLLGIIDEDVPLANIPKTGDENELIILAGALGISSLALAMLLLKGRRRKEEESEK